MDPLLKFNDFYNQNSHDYNDLFSLNENKTSAKYSKEEFKNIFSNSLNESDGFNDDVLESAHAYYEFSMLSEAKSHWLNTVGSPIYLDCDSHVILIKNGEGFLIEKSTFEFTKNLNESWNTLTASWNKLSKAAKIYNDSVVSAVEATGHVLSYGAKKALEFVKTCDNAIVKFIKGMSFVEWAALTMSILSAILGICGAIAEGSAVFAWLGPILTSIAGILQAVGGGLHLYEGSEKLKNAFKIMGMSDKLISPVGKMISSVSQALPEYIVGSGMICLGAYDLTKSATTLISPAGGIESVTVGTTVKSSLKGAVKEVAKSGGVIHHFIEHVGLEIIKKSGYSVTTSVGKEAVGKIFTAIISTVSSSILSSILGYIWEFSLKAGETITKGIEYLLDIPSKISSILNNFSKNSKDSTFFSIISKGLNRLVKPMTDTASSVISKYIKPMITNTREWFTSELKSHKMAMEIIEKYKHELHTGIKHHAVKAPEGKVKNPLAPKKKINIDKVTDKDVKMINKSINKSKKIKEGLTYLKYFGDTI